jgi:hypothetical protein
MTNIDYQESFPQLGASPSKSNKPVKKSQSPQKQGGRGRTAKPNYAKPSNKPGAAEATRDHKLVHQDSAPLQSPEQKLPQPVSQPAATKTPQPSTQPLNMQNAPPLQMPHGMHPGMAPNMMYMQNPGQNMQFMAPMGMMMPNMGMRPQFMMQPMGQQFGVPPQMQGQAPAQNQPGNKMATTAPAGEMPADASAGAQKQAFIDPAMNVLNNPPKQPDAPLKVENIAMTANLGKEPEVKATGPSVSNYANEKQGANASSLKSGQKLNQTDQPDDGEKDENLSKRPNEGGEAGNSGQSPSQPPKLLPPPAKKQAEDVPFDLIVESDLALRRRLNWLNDKEQKLSQIGAVALETYEDIFDELEQELEKAEEHTLSKIDQLDFSYNSEVTSYTKDRDIFIMKEKDPEKIASDFEKYMENLLRTDIVIRPSFRKDAYFKIHSFQWKSRQIHTYNLVNGELETTYIETSFNIPLFSRSIAIENGDIYLTGGLVKPYYLKTTFFYDEASNSFIKKADMNLPRADHSLIYLAGYIYAIGSYAHNKGNSPQGGF